MNWRVKHMHDGRNVSHSFIFAETTTRNITHKRHEWILIALAKFVISNSLSVDQLCKSDLQHSLHSLHSTEVDPCTVLNPGNKKLQTVKDSTSYDGFPTTFKGIKKKDAPKTFWMMKSGMTFCNKTSQVKHTLLGKAIFYSSQIFQMWPEIFH